MSSQETYQHFQARFYGAAFATYGFSMLVVPLKLWCRKQVGGWGNIGLDDYLLIVATIIENALFWLTVVAVRPHLGKHLEDVNPDERPKFMKMVFVSNILYLTCLASIKVSILALYWKLFGRAHKARVPIIVISCIVTIWFLVGTLILIFSCKPISASWDIAVAERATCLHRKYVHLGLSMPNIITDIALVILPVPYVLKLNAPMAQRVVLAGIFTLGIFVCVVSIVRLKFLSHTAKNPKDFTFGLREVNLWSLVEVNTGLACACLPSLRPLVRVLGLNRLFSFSGRSRPSRPSVFLPTSLRHPSGREHGAKSRSSRGFFSPKEGTSRVRNNDEDEFEMIVNEEQAGNKGENWSISRASRDTDSEIRSTGEIPQAGVGKAITTQDLAISIIEPNDKR